MAGGQGVKMDWLDTIIEEANKKGRFYRHRKLFYSPTGSIWIRRDRRGYLALEAWTFAPQLRLGLAEWDLQQQRWIAMEKGRQRAEGWLKEAEGLLGGGLNAVEMTERINELLSPQ